MQTTHQRQIKNTMNKSDKEKIFVHIEVQSSKNKDIKIKRSVHIFPKQNSKFLF